MHFGEHLTLDGYGGNEKKLNDKGIVLSILKTLPERLEMSILAQPQVFFAPGNDKKDPGGWSGYVIIAESHISLHTFPKRRFLSADVYTCQNGMQTDAIIEFFKEAFDLKDIETNFIKRGTSYPLENLH